MEKQFLLQYHLSRRSDEGHGNLRLVTALSLEEAKQKLINAVTYTYQDALNCEIIKPDGIKCLNID